MKSRLSGRYEDVAAIHDALYNYNLSKTGRARIEVHAERFPEQFALLACDDSGNSHGGVAFHWENNPRRVFADYFFLEEAVRGKGTGRAIFEEFIQLVRQAGARRIDLTTNTFQAPGFYLKMGFHVTMEKTEPSPRCPENIHYSLSREL
jgi:GNAT superfamily N-acetyltransferase